MLRKSNRGRRRSFRTVLVFACLVSFGIADAATVSGGKSGLSFSDTPNSAASVRITGPGGYVYQGVLPVAAPAGGFADGRYRYEITGRSGAPRPTSAYKQSLPDGRPAGMKASKLVQSVIEAGFFTVLGGKVVEDIGEEK